MTSFVAYQICRVSKRFPTRAAPGLPFSRVNPFVAHQAGPQFKRLVASPAPERLVACVQLFVVLQGSLLRERPAAVAAAEWLPSRVLLFVTSDVWGVRTGIRAEATLVLVFPLLFLQLSVIRAILVGRVPAPTWLALDGDAAGALSDVGSSWGRPCRGDAPNWIKPAASSPLGVNCQP